MSNPFLLGSRDSAPGRAPLPSNRVANGGVTRIELAPGLIQRVAGAFIDSSGRAVSRRSPQSRTRQFQPKQIGLLLYL